MGIADGHELAVHHLQERHVQHPVPEDEADDEEHDDAGQFPDQLEVLGSPAHAHQDGVERQEEVEAHLRAQGPGLGDAEEDLTGEVDLEEEVLGHHPLPPRAHRHRVEDIGQQGQGQPVGRHDAEEPAFPEPTGVGSPNAGEVGHGERAVEEEAGDQEEDRHPDLETAGVDAQRRTRRESGYPGGMEQQHQEHGDGPEPVEAGEVARRAYRRHRCTGGGSAVSGGRFGDHRRWLALVVDRAPLSPEIGGSMADRAAVPRAHAHIPDHRGRGVVGCVTLWHAAPPLCAGGAVDLGPLGSTSDGQTIDSSIDTRTGATRGPSTAGMGRDQ